MMPPVEEGKGPLRMIPGVVMPWFRRDRQREAAEIPLTCAPARRISRREFPAPARLLYL